MRPKGSQKYACNKKSNFVHQLMIFYMVDFCQKSNCSFDTFCLLYMYLFLLGWRRDGQGYPVLSLSGKNRFSVDSSHYTGFTISVNVLNPGVTYDRVI